MRMAYKLCDTPCLSGLSSNSQMLGWTCEIVRIWSIMQFSAPALRPGPQIVTEEEFFEFLFRHMEDWRVNRIEGPKKGALSLTVSIGLARNRNGPIQLSQFFFMMHNVCSGELLNNSARRGASREKLRGGIHLSKIFCGRSFATNKYGLQYDRKV